MARRVEIAATAAAAAAAAERRAAIIKQQQQQPATVAAASAAAAAAAESSSGQPASQNKIIGIQILEHAHSPISVYAAGHVCVLFLAPLEITHRFGPGRKLRALSGTSTIKLRRNTQPTT